MFARLVRVAIKHVALHMMMEAHHCLLRRSQAAKYSYIVSLDVVLLP